MIEKVWPPAECKCDFSTYMVGDGCMHCNPERWEDILRDSEEEEE